MITLKRLEANNFKSLRSVTLVFPEHGTVLVEGYNEAGKSTLFEAVYVALYGKPLVGEDKLARQEEVIQYGQSHAMVQLTFSVGQHELTISRHFERGKSQQAKLLIQLPGAQPEEVNRVRAVDERILKELGNLDGDSLRNSCFVEQKELGRIEALSLDQRQAEVRAASAEESELAERLDAVKVAIQVKRLTDLKKQKEEIEKRLTECIAQVQEARDRLSRCTALKEYVSQCDKVSHQITDISHTRTELLRIAGELERLDTIEQVELPQARVYLRDVSAAAEAVTQAVQARKRVQAAAEAVREARGSLKELEQVEAEQQQRENELAHAQTRIVQRRNEADTERQRFVQQLNEFEVKRLRLEDALASVKKWEAANKVLLALRLEISTAEEKEQALLKLQMEMRQREGEVRNLEDVVAHAEKEMQQASEAVRMATAYDALIAWIRLKGVEMTLSGYTTQRTELTTKRQEAGMSLATAQTKTRIPSIAAIALLVLAVLALILGLIWPAAFALCAIFVCGDAAAWLWYFRARKSKQQYSEALAHCTQELQQLDMQRQAAIQAGGDPVTLNQYEQQILASGLAVPSTLEAGRSLQEELRQQPGTTQGQHTLQKAAQIARDNHVRLIEQLRQVRSAAEGIGQELYLAQQSGNRQSCVLLARHRDDKNWRRPN